MPNPQHNIRCHVALDGSPSSDVTSSGLGWTDISRYVRMGDGISLSRGRQDETSQVGPGSANFLLDNDGRFTPGNTAGAYGTRWGIRRPVRFVSTTSTTEFRRNFCPNPSFEVDTYGWAGTGSATIARLASGGFTGAGCLEVTKAAVANSGAAQNVAGTATGMQTAVANQTYTASAYVQIPAGQEAGSLRLTVRLRTAGNTSDTATTQTFTTTAVTPGAGWVRISGSASSTLSTTALVGVEITQPTAGTAGQKFLVDGVMIEATSTVGTYFDGTTTGYAWEGTAHQSATVVNAPITQVWNGYIETLVEGWMNGVQPVVRVACSDVMAQYANRVMRALATEEQLYDQPSVLFPLTEAAGATSASTVAATPWSNANVTQAGTGGTLTFGQAASFGAESTTCAVFARSDSNNGKYLSWSAIGLGTTAGLGYEPWRSADNLGFVRGLPNFVAECYLFLPISIAGQMRVFEVSGSTSGDVMALDLNTNVPAITRLANGTASSLAGTTALNDGQWHHVAIAKSLTSNDLAIYLDGALHASVAGGFDGGFFDTLTIGASRTGTLLYNGWLSGVTVYGTQSTTQAGTLSRILERAKARLATLSETSLARANRITRLTFDRAAQTSSFAAGAQMGGQPFNGVSAYALLTQVGDAEIAPVYVNAAGQIRWTSRNQRTAVASPTTYTATQVSSTTGFTTSAFGVVNDVTYTRLNSTGHQVVDPTSITQYGRLRLDQTAYYDSDAQLATAATYVLNTRRQPQLRTGSLEVDMVAVDSAVPAASTLAVDIGSIVRVTGLPRGSATLVDVFVEGVNDTIRADSWTRTFNTSPLQVGGQVWLLGDATYGVLGVTTTLGI